MIQLKKNQQGLSLVEVIVSIGIISISSLIALMMMRLVGEGLSRSRSQETLTFLKQKIINTISNQASWDKTIALNPTMSCRASYPSSCLNGVSANIDLYDADGNKVLDSTSGLSYRRDGSICPAGGSAEECPLSITLGWKISCSTSEECKYPVDLLRVTFFHDPAIESKGFNSISYDINWTSRKSIANNASPLITCVQSGKVFIGIGQSFIDTSGVTQIADPNGCVPLSAFKGPRGFTGALGIQGGPGIKGANGIVGPGAGLPPLPPTPPITPPAPISMTAWCATSPQHNAICSSFLSRLGRQPDLTSAELYLNVLTSGGSIAQVEALMSSSLESLAQVAAGTYAAPSAVGPNGIEMGTDIYPGGIATTAIDGVSVSFTFPPGKSLSPEQVYASYVTAAQAKGLDVSKTEVLGAIEKVVIGDVAVKIKKSH